MNRSIYQLRAPDEPASNALNTNPVAREFQRNVVLAREPNEHSIIDIL